jgi:hypothetical protein
MGPRYPTLTDASEAAVSCGVTFKKLTTSQTESIDEMSAPAAALLPASVQFADKQDLSREYLGQPAS